MHATTAKDSFWVNYQLAELEAALPPEEFFRARREVLVNMSRIKEIKPYFKSSFLLVMSDAASTEIAVSERQARPLRQRLPSLVRFRKCCRTLSLVGTGVSWGRADFDLMDEKYGDREIRRQHTHSPSRAFMRCNRTYAVTALASALASHRDKTVYRLSRTVSTDCNFISRRDDLRDNSKPVRCFEERSFNIWQFDVDRRVVKRPVVHWTSDSGFENRSSGCGLIWHQIGWDTTGFHIRKLSDRAVDRKKCDVWRTAPSPDLPPMAMPKCVAKMHELDIFCLDEERDLGVTQAINRRQRSHGEWPD